MEEAVRADFTAVQLMRRQRRGKDYTVNNLKRENRDERNNGHKTMTNQLFAFLIRDTCSPICARLE